MKVKSESEVAQSCPTRSDPMDCSLPGSSVHGIFQARVLEWLAIGHYRSWVCQEVLEWGYTEGIGGKAREEGPQTNQDLLPYARPRTRFRRNDLQDMIGAEQTYLPVGQNQEG